MTELRLLIICFVLFQITPCFQNYMSSSDLYEGSCIPVLCSCHNSIADCSSKRFLSMPVGLPESIYQLDLSSNEMLSVNSSEITRIKELQILDLSRNFLTELIIGIHYKLAVIDLSHNSIHSVRSLKLDGLLNLAELNLSYNKIVSLPPNALAGSSNKLRLLNIKNNKIVSLEPGSLDNLTALEELTLSKNSLSSFPKGIFMNMSLLRILELNRNKFVEIVGLSFHGLSNLEILRLRRNSIEFLMDGAFFGLQHIRELSLEHNQVRSIHKGWLYGLYTLRTLNMASNVVEHISDDGWEFCINLYELDLSNNRLQILGRDTLRLLPQLRVLNLQNNLISHIQADEATFMEVPMLETLLLDGNIISHTIEDMEAPFHGLHQLRRLSIAYNHIKSVGRRAFYGGLNSLQLLNLTGNTISSLDKDCFSKLPSLTSLHIQSSSLLCDCHLKWFPRWLNETGIRGSSRASCAHPELLKERLMLSISYESFTCNDFPKPYILEQPITQIALRGHNQSLSCRAASTSSTRMDFSWWIDSKKLELPTCARTSHINCIAGYDHSFDGKGKEFTSELRLFNLVYRDAGKYQCVVSNRFGVTYSDKVSLKVYVFPSFVVTPEDITVMVGATATMKCAAQGVPPPKVFWAKDGGGEFPAASERRITFSETSRGNKKKHESVDRFIIHDVRAVDMGIYTCTALNPAGSITWNITLTVLEAPKFVKAMEPKTVIAGNTAVMACMFTGSPKPRLTWTKDGGPFLTNERHFFAADNQLLIIVKAQSNDSGLYRCTMQNQLGIVSDISNLTIVSSLSRDASLVLNKGFFPGSDSQTMDVIIIVIILVISTMVLVWIVIAIQKLVKKCVSLPAPSLDYLEFMQMGQDPDPGEFDIGQHIRQTMANVASHTEVSKNRSRTTSPTCSSERDSGTGDSKKSNNMDEDDEEVTAFLAVQDTSLLCSIYDEGAGESTASMSGGGVDDIREGGESRASFSEFQINSIPLGDVEDVTSSFVTTNSSSNIVTAGESRIVDSPVDLAASMFRTFRPRLYASQDYLSSVVNENSLGKFHRRSIKRASAYELNGTCYMPVSMHQDFHDNFDIPVEPSVYRGGTPRITNSDINESCRQKMLEASFQSVSDNCHTPRRKSTYLSLRKNWIRKERCDRRRGLELLSPLFVDTKEYKNSISTLSNRTSVQFRDNEMFS